MPLGSGQWIVVTPACFSHGKFPPQSSVITLGDRAFQAPKHIPSGVVHPTVNAYPSLWIPPWHFPFFTVTRTCIVLVSPFVHGDGPNVWLFLKRGRIVPATIQACIQLFSRLQPRHLVRLCSGVLPLCVFLPDRQHSLPWVKHSRIWSLDLEVKTLV